MSDQSKVPCELSMEALFKPGHTAAWDYLAGYKHPWDALPGIEAFIIEFGGTLDKNEYEKRDGGVWIHKTAMVAPTSYIGESVIIGAGAEIRHGAFIRGNTFVGAGAVVGNSTELKNVILFDGVQTPHYNYVGDSILGYKSHMGAGAITSNVKSDRTPVTVAFGGGKVDTGLKKFGAILGDYVEVGCNSVLNPGTVVGAGAFVYPLSMVRGYVQANSIYKRQGEVAEKI